MKTFILSTALVVAGQAAGAQWTPVASNTNAEFRGLVAVSPTVVWASGTRGRVARTTDGGATWKVDTIPGADSLDLRAVAARSATHAWASELRSGREGAGAHLSHGEWQRPGRGSSRRPSQVYFSTRLGSGTTGTALR